MQNLVPKDVVLYNECEIKAESAADNNIIDFSQIVCYTDHLYKSKGGTYEVKK